MEKAMVLTIGAFDAQLWTYNVFTILSALAP